MARKRLTTAEMLTRLGYPRPLTTMIDSPPTGLVNALVFIDHSPGNAEIHDGITSQQLLDELEKLRRSGVREGACIVTYTPAEYLALRGGESTWGKYWASCVFAEVYWQDERWMVTLPA